MAYIAPDSLIMLLKGVPLEPDYEHTVRLPQGSQSGTLSSYRKYAIDKHTYQRVNSNTIRVGIIADNLYDCNYMMFQNSAFSNRWFYAFITEVNYINNECTEIKYEIDVMQTYMYDWQIGTCYVEREHIAVDTFGANIVPESLNTGDLIAYTSEATYSLFSRLGVFILVATDYGSITDVGNLYDNIFHGGSLFCIIIDQSDLSGTQTRIRTFLSAFNNEPEKILGIWTAPAPDNLPSPGGRVTTFGDGNSLWNLAPPFVSHGTTFGSYQPKNNKLFTFPYNAIRIVNGLGQEGLYRYEFFDDGTALQTASFRIYNSAMYPPEYTLVPIGYKGISGANHSEALTIKGWGAGSWTADTWQRMLEIGVIDSSFEFIKGAAIGVMSGNPMYAASGAMNGMLHTAEILAKRDYVSPTTYGSSNTGSALASNNALTFRATRVGVTPEFAQVIDNYFTRYGYQTNKLKEPNLDSRPHWNYVKTNGCELKTGEGLPAQYAAKIKQIFDKGITFWKQITEVGRFDLDNSPS